MRWRLLQTIAAVVLFSVLFTVAFVVTGPYMTAPYDEFTRVCVSAVLSITAILIPVDIYLVVTEWLNWVRRKP
jgi:hypothetical protein